MQFYDTRKRTEDQDWTLSILKRESNRVLRVSFSLGFGSELILTLNSSQKLAASLSRTYSVPGTMQSFGLPGEK